MSKLEAIPVGQGDAFLLTRYDGTTILVDGGRARIPFSSQVSSLISHVDVVVCTHADADHAEGLIGLLQTSLVPIREVWLPGRWCSRLADLCGDRLTFLQELHRDVSNADSRSSLDKIVEVEELPADSSMEFESERIISALEDEDGLEPDPLVAEWPWLDEFLPDSKWKLWTEAIQTAARIRDVARAAHHHGARLRWFDFDEFKNGAAPSGGEAFLRPLNSVELTRRHALRKLGALRFLALSVANRESLVFLAPETESDSPVVFAADSDLACGGVPRSSRKIAVTAPHHGSEANMSAYGTVSGASSDVIWIRSDGNYKKRPGAAFLRQPMRVCTLCRNGGAPKQTARLHDSASGWELATGVRGCNCS